MGEILTLLAKITGIIAGGVTAIEAVMKVSRESGVDFSTLWNKLPSKWK